MRQGFSLERISFSISVLDGVQTARDFQNAAVQGDLEVAFPFEHGFGDAVVVRDLAGLGRDAGLDFLAVGGLGIPDLGPVGRGRGAVGGEIGGKNLGSGALDEADCPAGIVAFREAELAVLVGDEPVSGAPVDILDGDDAVGCLGGGQVVVGALGVGSYGEEEETAEAAGKNSLALHVIEVRHEKMSGSGLGSAGSGIQGILVGCHVADGAGEGKVVRCVRGGDVDLKVDLQILGERDGSNDEKGEEKRNLLHNKCLLLNTDHY